MQKLRRALFVGALTLIASSGTVLAGEARSASWNQMEGYALPIDPEEASHIRHLTATKYAIYALSIHHKLLRFPFDGTPATEETLPGWVTDIAVGSNGKLWVVTVEALSHNIFVMTPDREESDQDGSPNPTNIEYPRWKVSLPLSLTKRADRKSDDESVYTIAAGDKFAFVLTDQRLAEINKSTGEWKTTILDHPFDLVELENPISLVQNDRWIWYGTDAGEFGRHLVMADFRSGETSNPWDSDPVTAIVPTDGGEHCVLFTIGLAHLGLTEGGIYKTCGNKPVATFLGNEPIWDLVSTKTNVFALSQGALIPMKDDKPDFNAKIPFPHKVEQSVAGLPARVISDVLVLYSGARWEVSTSGLTPYAISIPQGANLQLQPYPQNKKYLSDCKNSKPESPEDEDIGVQPWEKDSVTLENGDPGFEFTLKGWNPNGEFSLYGIDSACRIVALVAPKKLQGVSKDGTATISIPYAMRGLHMGQWLFFVSVNVSGKHGLFEFPQIIPKVIYPGNNGDKWRLDFDAATKNTATH